VHFIRQRATLLLIQKKGTSIFLFGFRASHHDQSGGRETERERERDKGFLFLFCCCIMEFTVQGGLTPEYRYRALLHIKPKRIKKDETNTGLFERRTVFGKSWHIQGTGPDILG
jgi:hypothetical protein